MDARFRYLIGVFMKAIKGLIITLIVYLRSLDIRNRFVQNGGATENVVANTR